MKAFTIALSLALAVATQSGALAAGEEKAPFGIDCGRRILKTLDGFYYEGNVDPDIYFMEIVSSKRTGRARTYERAQAYLVEVQVNEGTAKVQVVQDGHHRTDCRVIAVQVLDF